MDDPKNGIFRREGENAEIHASSRDERDFRKMFECDDSFYDYPSDRPNQYYTANLKDGSSVIINGYMLRGNKLNKNY